MSLFHKQAFVWCSRTGTFPLTLLGHRPSKEPGITGEAGLGSSALTWDDGTQSMLLYADVEKAVSSHQGHDVGRCHTHAAPVRSRAAMRVLQAAEESLPVPCLPSASDTGALGTIPGSPQRFWQLNCMGATTWQQFHVACPALRTLSLFFTHANCENKISLWCLGKNPLLKCSPREPRSRIL